MVRSNKSRASFAALLLPNIITLVYQSVVSRFSKKDAVTCVRIYVETDIGFFQLRTERERSVDERARRDGRKTYIKSRSSN